MKEKTRSIKIELPHTNLYAEIGIERDGQQHPSKGDNVIIKYTLSLSGLEEGNFISQKIQFGGRVELLNEALGCDWGYVRKGRRYREGRLTAKKWAEGFKLAEEKCKKDLLRLVNALNQRHQALLDAGRNKDLAAEKQALKGWPG